MNRSFSTLRIVGDVGIDLVMGSIDGWPQIGTEVVLPRSELRAGGSAANAALAMRHLGLQAQLISAIGNDHFGSFLRAQFGGVDARFELCDTASALSVGIMHACGERNFFTTQGHLEHLSFEHVTQHLAPALRSDEIVLLTGVFLLPRLCADYLPLLETIRALGYRIALDTGWPTDNWTDANRALMASWLPHCDHLLINELEAISITAATGLESALYRLAALMKSGASVVVKTGARGATGLQYGQITEHRSASAAIFDTVGAGDAFNAGYLAQRLRGGSLAQALATGCRTAVAILERFPRRAIAPGEFAHCLAGEGAQ